MKFEHDEFVEMGGTPDVSFELPKGYRKASFTSSRQVVAIPAAQSQRDDPSTVDIQKSQGSGIAPSLPHEFQHHTRAHVRTVYAEVCRSIYELRDYATVASALRDNVKALWYLRKAGYVHRDVSAGNCLWDIASEKGKLSDLEYARPYDKLSMHDPLT
ncbi:hypothetical protein H0H87_012979, partial [Tephrocybe sp. NHM501043]